jgi:glycosyltransferase involved in cell wall biosynthesis
MAGAAEGGAELFFERLCIALHRAGESVLPAIRRNPGRAALLREAGLAPAEFAFGPPIDLLTRPRLRAALVRFAPDIAIFWMNRANRHAPRGDWISVGRLGGYYDLKYYRDRDHLVGNTRGIVAWLRRQGWPEARTHYLPNFAADFAGATPADRAALAVPPGHRLLLALGRLHADKGFDTLIRALPMIPRATLAIAGAGPEHAALTALARGEGVADRVRFLGWRHDAGALLRAADVFVCSSRVEPLGNMVLEAWSPTDAMASSFRARSLAPWPMPSPACSAMHRWRTRSPGPGGPASRRNSRPLRCWRPGAAFSAVSRPERMDLFEETPRADATGLVHAPVGDRNEHAAVVERHPILHAAFLAQLV